MKLTTLGTPMINEKISEHMKGNTNKRKPLQKQEIPNRFKGTVIINVGTFPIGKRHQEMFSQVKCITCNKINLSRNSRIRENLVKYNYLYACQKCAGKLRGKNERSVS